MRKDRRVRVLRSSSDMSELSDGLLKCKYDLDKIKGGQKPNLQVTKTQNSKEWNHSFELVSNVSQELVVLILRISCCF